MQQSIPHKIYPINRNLDAVWFVEFSINGKRLKKYGRLAKLHTVGDRLREAQRIINEFEHKHKQENGSQKASISDIIIALEKTLTERCIYLRKKSAATYRSKLTIFVKWLRIYRNDFHIRELGIGLAFIQYLRDQNLSPTTINAYRNTLKSLFEWAKLNDNSFKDVRKLKENRRSYRYFSESQQQELSSIIPAMNKQLWLACQFQYYLLLRPNELRLIKCGNFDFSNGRAIVPGTFSKNHKTLPVIIPSNFLPAIEFLKDYPPHFYVFGNNGFPGKDAYDKKHFPTLHQKIMKRINYDHNEYKFYSWKHTGAVMYYLATGDVKSLKEQGRWHSLDMVNEYLKNLGVLDLKRVQNSFPAIGAKL